MATGETNDQLALLPALRDESAVSALLEHLAIRRADRDEAFGRCARNALYDEGSRISALELRGQVKALDDLINDIRRLIKR